MPGKGCSKRGHRKHTPIVSKKQAGLFGAVAGGAKTKAPSLSVAEAKRHLREMGTMKKLPLRVKKRRDRGFSAHLNPPSSKGLKVVGGPNG